MNNLQLNTLKPAPGSRTVKKRLGKGVGSGWGKTAGRGHKGQHARKGGFHKVGFEGGQTPIQSRLRKFGFQSPLKHNTQAISLDTLEKLDNAQINFDTLQSAHLLKQRTQQVKIIATGKLTKILTITGIKVSKGARSIIESIGGKIESE